MTRKAERAKNIRRLTPSDKESLAGCGAVVDESLPAAVQTYIAKSREIVAKESFAASFAGILGIFRDRKGESTLPIGKQIKLLDETRTLLDELCVRLDHLPQLVNSFGMFVRWKGHAESFDLCRGRLNAEAWSMLLTLDAVQEEVENSERRQGEPPSEDRDRLFQGTIQLLPSELTKSARARIVGELLSLSGVGVPADEKELCRLATKVGKIAP